MHVRIVVIAGSLAAVAAGGIVAATVMASTGTASAAKTTVAEPAVVATPPAPTWDVAPTTTAPRPTATASPRRSVTATAAPTTGTITYVVKRGDNLSIIAAWFHLHGYGALYDANRAVIGANPNLIFPGQRITISDGHLTMSIR
jgi:nucleoid-associated protein YgaU